MPLHNIEDQVIIALRRITRAIDLHSRGLLQAVGLTAPQLAALKAIGRLQPITAGELANSIHLSQATLSGILTRLENRSLVSRARSAADRRAVLVELTEQGRAVLQTAPSLLQDRFRRELLQLAGWERTQMLATLQRIASIMEDEEIDSTVPRGYAEGAEELSQLFDHPAAPVERDGAPGPSAAKNGEPRSAAPANEKPPGSLPDR